jgi:glycosyltransferase involved in cell wall biosynthesis
LKLLILNWLDRENPQAGGAEVHLHEVFGRLVDRGHEVTLLTSGWKGAAPRCTLDGIEVHRTGSRYTLSVAAPRYYRKYLRRELFDSVVEDLNKVLFFSPSWVRAPVILLVHHLFGGVAFQEVPLPVAVATWILERPVPRAYHGTPTIAVSKSTADDLVRRGMRPGWISVIPNGIDPDSFHPVRESDRFDEPSALYLGRLKRYKRIDLIVDAIGELRDRGVFLMLRIGGKGDYEAQLRRKVERMSLQDRVVFEGFVTEERKHELFSRSWVHLLTSPKEGWGIANLEAAASGTPTVASDSPGLRDSVLDGHSGFLVPHGDVRALAGRITDVVTDESLRARLASGAIHFARSFTWDRAADDVESFVQERVAEFQRPV